MAKVVLAKILKRRGISKRKFAKMNKVHYHNVFRWFKPDYDPKLSKLSGWSKMLSCRIRDLYEE